MLRRPDTHNNFDLLRLLAALQVAYFHAVFHLRVELGAAGRAIHEVLGFFPGVPIFFVISGFLISKSYERAPSVRAYARNRFLRVYPALWAAFVVSLGILAWHGAIRPAFVTSPSFFAWIAAQLTVGQAYTPAALRDYGVGTPNGSLWTIPVEIGFYILVPLIYAAIRRLRAALADATLAFLALASYTVSWAIVRRPDFEQSIALKLVFATAIPHLYQFLLGVLLHRNFARVRRLLEGRALAWTAGYIALMLGADALLGPERRTHYAVALASNLLLAGWVLSVAFTRRGLSERLLSGNDLSYGLYIYHMLVVNVFVQRGATGQGSHVVAALSISLALAGLSWRLLESKALRLKRVGLPASPPTA
jgi:peptidoglycan/LPS O-acetylase OafA/YrhL